MARIGILGIKRLPAVAGADGVVEHLLRHAPDGHEYTVYLVREGGSHADLPAGVRVVRIPAAGGKHFGPFSYFVACALHALVRGHYDLVHVHNSDAGFVLPLLRLRPHTRIVGTFHGDPYLRAKWGPAAKIFLKASESLFIRLSTALTSVSAVRRGGSVPVEHIPNGVEPSAGPSPAAGTILARFGLKEGGYVLFAAGRVDETKGLHDLLAAYRRTSPPLPLMVVGDFSHDPPYTAKLDAMLRGLPVTVHRGLLPKRELSDLMCCAAAFVFPSHVEAMSMVLLEALAAGPPVVCSDIPENLAVVGPGYPWLFRTGDSGHLGTVLGEALRHGSARNGPAMGGFAALPDWRQVALRYDAVYRRVLARKQGAG